MVKIRSSTRHGCVLFLEDINLFLLSPRRRRRKVIKMIIIAFPLVLKKLLVFFLNPFFSKRLAFLKLLSSLVDFLYSVPISPHEEEDSNDHCYPTPWKLKLRNFVPYDWILQKKMDGDGDLLPEFADAEEKELYEFLDLQLQSDLNEERMRHYEVVYLIHENHAEDVESINQKVQEFMKEKKGKVWRFSDWGMRRLAYKIHKAENAHYILTNFEIEAKYLNEFKGLLDSDERVIRHLVMKRDEAITEDCPPPPEFHSVRVSMDEDEDDEEEFDEDEEEFDEDEDGDNVEYEVDDDGNVVMVLYEDEDKEEANEPEEGQNQPNNGKRDNRKTVSVGG